MKRTATFSSKPWSRLVIPAFLVGFALLAMENIWIRETSLRVGSTLLSFTWVLAVFLVAGAAGSLLAGGMRLGQVRLLVLALMAWAVSAFLLHLFRDRLFALVTGTGEMRHLFSLLMAGPPCLFAGMIFPVMSDLATRSGTTRTAGAGTVYFANLCGAAAGTLASVLLVPRLMGFNLTFLLASCLLAGAALLLFVFPPQPTAELAETNACRAEPPRGNHAAGVAIILVSGFLVMGLEILFFYYFRLIMRTVSFFAVAAILAAFILGLGGGTAHAVRLRRRGCPPADGIIRCALIAAGVIFLYVLVFSRLSATPLHRSSTALTHIFQALGLALALAVPLLVFAGAIYPLAWELVSPAEGRQRRAFGMIAALGSLAGAAGALAVPYGLIPLLGLNRSFIALGLVYLAVAGFLGRGRLLGRRGKIVNAGLVVILALLVASLCHRHPAMPLTSDMRVISRCEGRSDLVAVIEEGATGSRRILLNHSYALNGTGRALLQQRNEAFLPLLIHPGAKDVLFIGMGSGISAASLLAFPVEHLTAVELVPEVATMAKEHFGAWNNALFTHPGSRVVVGDGRIMAAASPGRYDLVICDLFHPGLDGAEKMYSLEFFRSAREALAADGMFCLWLPFHQLAPTSLGIITRTFLETFPCAIAIRANLDPMAPVVGYLGSSSRIDLATTTLAARLADERVRALARENPYLRSVANFRCILVMDLRAHAGRFAPFPLNTDDRPHLAYVAGLGGGRERLIGFRVLEWLGQRQPEPDFPSLVLGHEDIPETIAGMRAGNYYYAAAAAGTIPDEKHAHRWPEMLGKSIEYFATARRISPDSDFTEAEFD